MKVNTLHDLFIDQLKDIYSAEKQITHALPKMAKAAQSDDVRQAFQDHLEMTKSQIERLDQIFQQLGTNPGRKKCLGMEGLLKEADEALGEGLSPDVMDAALIANAQRVEHYEIAAYGTVRTYANMMGQTNAMNLLQQTLDEEGQTDKLLSKLAEQHANFKAEQHDSSQMSGHGSMGSRSSK